MPHCILWQPSDWSFALDTARLHAGFSAGSMTAAKELRVREGKMGIGWAARRDLRIRYVDPLPTQAQVETEQEEDTRLLRLVDG
jgi:hypothetical protein